MHQEPHQYHGIIAGKVAVCITVCILGCLCIQRNGAAYGTVQQYRICNVHSAVQVGVTIQNVSCAGVRTAAGNRAEVTVVVVVLCIVVVVSDGLVSVVSEGVVPSGSSPQTSSPLA